MGLFSGDEKNLNSVTETFFSMCESAIVDAQNILAGNGDFADIRSIDPGLENLVEVANFYLAPSNRANIGNGLRQDASGKVYSRSTEARLNSKFTQYTKLAAQLFEKLIDLKCEVLWGASVQNGESPATTEFRVLPIILQAWHQPVFATYATPKFLIPMDDDEKSQLTMQYVDGTLESKDYLKLRPIWRNRVQSRREARELKGQSEIYVATFGQDYEYPGADEIKFHF